MEESDILTACALRFDGWKYCEDVGWAEEDRLRVTDRLVESLEIPTDPMRRLALFFMLQRYLFKWGGETLPRDGFDWRALRTLFLLTVDYEIPARWKQAKYGDIWPREFEPRAAECISMVARQHAKGYQPAKSQEVEADEGALNYYNLEQYLFEAVNKRFHAAGKLDAFDFFSIVIWKANRSKSKIAKRLLTKTAATSLDEAVEQISSDLSQANDAQSRFTVMIGKYGFYPPMASAILTVLWPDEFSIYDVRVCEILNGFHALASMTDSAKAWPIYLQYLEAVRQKVPGELPLRDKDRILWARSAMDQLLTDIERKFLPTPT